MNLESMISRTEKSSIIATIVGEAGVGKTTFASTFPSPIFIRAEDGIGKLQVDALPHLKNVEMLWDQLKLLISEEHSYKTVVIDSVTKLDNMFVDYVVDSDPKKPKSINVALGGFGAGLSAVAGMHSRVRKAAQILCDKGINVIFIAHADIVNIDLPDTDGYMKYDLRLNKKSSTYYVDDVDLIGYVRLEAFTSENDKGKTKVISDGTRELITYATAANVSKNRFGIKDKIILEEGINPLVKYIPFLSNK